MLAPLENRSLIEREPALSLEERVAQLEAANLALRDALRESRQAQKRSATLAARKIVAQTTRSAGCKACCTPAANGRRRSNRGRRSSNSAGG